MRLFHYSENPDIHEFAPRSPLARPEAEPLVWAIDEQGSPLYYFPRECPRVCFWKMLSTNEADAALFDNTVSGRIVIAIEFGWIERLRETALYRYEFSPECFQSETESQIERYGAYVSRRVVRPLAVEPMGDLMLRLKDSGVELRLCQSLQPIARAVSASSLHFSLIRMRNCQN